VPAKEFLTNFVKLHEGKKKAAPGSCFVSVGDTGIEPVTSSVSGKRATAAPIARSRQNRRYPGFGSLRIKRADDEIRTRDIHLGKVVLYQLSYVRIFEVQPWSRTFNYKQVSLLWWAILGSNQ
jgi:hypothetical protein